MNKNVNLREEDKKNAIDNVKRISAKMIYAINAGACTIKKTFTSHPETESVTLMDIDGEPGVTYTIESKSIDPAAVISKYGVLVAVLLLSMQNIKQTEIASSMNKSQSWVSLQVKTLKYVRDALAAGKTAADIADIFKISLTDATQLYKLYKEGTQ
jgi:hypothetical protein